MLMVYVRSKASKIDRLLDERNDLKILYELFGDERYWREIKWVDERLRRLVMPNLILITQYDTKE
jgi:hypothetical protein